MRDPKRIYKVCATLAEIWQKVPDWRFCQLMDNFQRWYIDDTFYMEDDQFEQELKKYIEEMTK